MHLHYFTHYKFSQFDYLQFTIAHMYILQQNLQIMCKERWRYLVSKSAELSFSTKSVAVHMSGAVLCKKNFGQISENAVEQLQVPRNQRELTFATISLKERCTD